MEALINNYSIEQEQEEKIMTIKGQHGHPSESLLELEQSPKDKTKTNRGSKRKQKLSDDGTKEIQHGHWNNSQNKLYHWFLELHYKHFVNRHMRRMDKIFKTMQIFIGTRQAEQCRSHHQKMEKKHLTFAAIITNLRQAHYQSLNTQPIVEQLNQKGIKLEQPLASIDELKDVDYQLIPITRKRSVGPRPISNKKKSQRSYNSKQISQERIGNPQIIDEQMNQNQNGLMQQIQQGHNMFEDIHQNIGQISIIHDKQDQSSIFKVFDIQM